jgi:tetratricopeptide (TPR) repeat protein
MGKIFLNLSVVLLVAGRVFAADATPTNPVTKDDAILSQQVINAYKSVQEQQEATMRAVQQAREEAAANARKQTEALEARLQRLEQTVNDTAAEQRDRDGSSRRESRRFTLIMFGISAGAAVLAVLVIVAMLRAVVRRPAVMPVQPMPVGGLTGGETGLAALNPAQESNARLRASLERLEQRLGELETSAQLPASPTAEAATLSQQVEQISSRVALLLGKGEALLNLQQVDTALACYDEVIALDPTNAEAFVKKGAALEKLGQLDDAIVCYDKAIALDTSMTMAYLCKGGVFNRLERHAEAVQCYEQALRAQQQLRV